MSCKCTFKQGQVNKVGVKDNNDHQAFDMLDIIMVVVKFKEEKEVYNETTDDIGDGRKLLQHHSALNMEK